jgi:aryl carrier-like protein
MNTPSSPADPAVTALGTLPGVVDAAIFLTADGSRLLAVVPGPQASLVDLRDHLWDSLSAPDLPDLLVPVDDLRRDATGSPGIDVSNGYLTGTGVFRFREPASATEVAVAAIWAEVLGRARVGVDDNFLDLGGDSLTALLLFDLTNKRLGSRLTLLELLSAPSLAALAQTIDEQS